MWWPSGCPPPTTGTLWWPMIDDEATVKRLYREKNQVRLQPENPDFQPIYSDHASVLGKVIAVMRYY